MKQRKKYLISIVIIVCFIIGCCFVSSCGDRTNRGKDVIGIECLPSDTITVELGEEINLGDYKVKVDYKDGTSIKYELKNCEYNIYEITSANDSVGEKKIKIFFDDAYGYETDLYITIKVVEKSYRMALKDEINNYKSELKYSSANLQKIKDIKLSCLAAINASSDEEEANSFVVFSKQQIDVIKTIDEEEKEVTVLDLLNKIDKLENDMKEFVNYDDTKVKEEIESIKSILNESTVEEDIEQVKLVVSSLSSSFHGVKQKVINNTDKINAITSIINSAFVDAATKDELMKISENIKKEYTQAIDNMSIDLIKKMEEVDIIIDNGVLKWKNGRFDDYIEIVDLNGVSNSGILDAGLNEEGHLIIELSNGESIDAGVVYDINANEKIAALEKTLVSVNESIAGINESIEMLFEIVDDVDSYVTLMDEYFQKMGFDFENGSSSDLIVAVMRLLPAELKNMGYDVTLEDLESYGKDLPAMKANYDILMNMVNEIKNTTERIYNISIGEGTMLEKEALMYEEINNVSKVLKAMGIDENKSLAIEKFLDDIKAERDKDLVVKIEKYFDTFYNDSDYKLDENVLKTYYNECVEYSKKTKYDSYDKLIVLKEELKSMLTNIDVFDSNIFAEIVNIEKQVKVLDSNVEIVKAFFASKLENEGVSFGLNNKDIIEYKNRILVSKDITKVIEIYELAIS